MYQGWQEVERASRFDSWERARIMSYYSLASNPYAKPPKKPSDLFSNPYEEKKEKEVRQFTLDEVKERIKRFDQLKYTEVNG